MIQENQYSLQGFVVWIICAFFFLYEFFLRTVVGTFQPTIMSDLNISYLQFSVLSTTTFISIYAAMQIPVGLIVDNIGLKKSLLIGCIACAVSSFGFAFSHHYYIAMIYRVVMGFGASFGFICLLMSVCEWMPKKNIAIFIGLSQFIGTMGPMLAAGPIDTIASESGLNWRIVFTMLGGIGIVLFLLVAIFVENNKQFSGKYVILHKPQSVKDGILKLFARKQPWFIALFSAFIYCAVEYLSENEGRSFIVLKGFTANTASYMLTISWLGYAIGCPISGFISDLLERRKIVIVFLAFCSVIAITTLVFASNKTILFFAFFLLGVSASGQTIGFALIIEHFKKEFVAVGLALNNAMMGLIISINAPVIGNIIDSMRNNEDAPLQTDYYIAFSLLIIVSLCALLVSLIFIKETYCKSSVEFTCLRHTP